MNQLLYLTRDEVITLTDRIQNTDCGTEEKFVRPYDLLLKLGSAYLELVTLDGAAHPEVPVAVTESEAWLLRSKITSMDKTALDPLFGVKLLRKLYEILEAYNAGLDLQTTSDAEDRDPRSIREALARWREKENGRTDQNNT
jgi:hypothetical protein